MAAIYISPEASISTVLYISAGRRGVGGRSETTADQQKRRMQLEHGERRCGLKSQKNESPTGYNCKGCIFTAFAKAPELNARRDSNIEFSSFPTFSSFFFHFVYFYSIFLARIRTLEINYSYVKQMRLTKRSCIIEIFWDSSVKPRKLNGTMFFVIK